MAKKLTGYELTLIHSTIKYLIDKESVISRTFPSEFIKNSFLKLRKEEREGLMEIIKKYKDLSGDQLLYEWQKLLCLLDVENRTLINIDENTHILCFVCNEKYYPVSTYLENPEKELPLDEKFII